MVKYDIVFLYIMGWPYWLSLILELYFCHCSCNVWVIVTAVCKPHHSFLSIWWKAFMIESLLGKFPPFFFIMSQVRDCPTLRLISAFDMYLSLIIPRWLFSQPNLFPIYLNQALVRCDLCTGVSKSHRN